MTASNIPAANSYSIGDAIKFLSQFPDSFFTGIATSPPYNKHFLGRTLSPNRSNWQSSVLMGEGYDSFSDALPEEDYVEQQQQLLVEAVRCVGEAGVVLYNTGRKIFNHTEDRRENIIAPVKHNLRQTIIWDRTSTNNMGGSHPTIFPPRYELVYVIAGKQWKLPEKHVKEMRYWGDVWRIQFETRNPHPAPWPLPLAERLAKTCGSRVCDPYAGSGTLAIAAESLESEWWMNDISIKYKTMFEKRLKNVTRQMF